MRSATERTLADVLRDRAFPELEEDLAQFERTWLANQSVDVQARYAKFRITTLMFEAMREAKEEPA